MEGWTYGDDEWAGVMKEIFKDYEETGMLNTDAVLPLANQLKDLVVAGMPPAGTAPVYRGTGYTLRREPARSSEEHFRVNPMALAKLNEQFLPASILQAGTNSSPEKRRSPTTSRAGRTGDDSTAKSSGDSTAKAGLARAPGTTGPLMSARPRPAGGSSSSAPAPKRIGAGGGGAAAAAAAKRSRMKMMDVDEANSMLLATTKGKEPKKPKAAKAAAEKPKADPFAGALVDAPTGLVHYYQDRLKKWTYVTDDTGGKLLRGMFALATPLIARVVDELPDGKEGEGRRIYAQKPNLGANGVTWSQEDYGHRGLQAEYLRLKSVQRFTEGWVAMQRAYNAGAFAHLMGEGAPASATLRIASLGGGPGFELVAARAFCERYLPAVKLDLVSLDLAKEWQPCAEGLGLRFGVWDVNDGEGVLRAAGMQRIDLAIISYVLYHYMSTEHCADWMARRITANDIGNVMIISRFEDLAAQIRSVETRGVRVLKMMNQPRFSGRTCDDRQLLYASAQTPPLTPLPADQRVPTIFPNVPHEDNKDERDRSYEELQPLKAEGEPSAAEDEPKAVLQPPPPPAAPSSSAASAPAAAFTSPWGYDSKPAAAPPPPAAPVPPPTDSSDLPLPEEVPEALHASVRSLAQDPSRMPDVATVLAFFGQRADAQGAGGTREIVLQIDEASGKEVVLKLDFGTWTWKRVARKAKKPGA